MKKLLNKVKHTYLQVKLWTLVQLTLREVNEQDKPIYKPLLNNTARALQNVPHAAIPPKVAISLSKQIVDRLIVLKHAILFQPMLGPVGQAYMLRLKQVEPVPGTISIEIVSEVLQAKTAALSVKWNLEAMKDLEQLHGVDAEDEFLAASAATMAEETIGNVLQILQDVATDKRTATSATLPFALNQAAAKIAHKTRRGMGNVIITSPAGLDALRATKVGYLFVPNRTQYNGTLTHVGDLCTHEDCPRVVYKVLVASAGLESSENIDFLVLYRNSNTEIDAGYVYAPYVPAMFSGLMIDPETFTPILKVYARYAMVANGERAGDYFSVVRLIPEDTK